MASYTSTQTGAWSDTATWGGSGPPVAGDTVVVATGHTVTVSGAQACATYTLQGTGTLTVATGAVLTYTSNPVVEGSPTPGNRLIIEAGGVLECDPAGGASVLTLGVVGTMAGNTNHPILRLNGSAGNRAVIRKKAGATGTFTIQSADAGTYYVSGGKSFFSADHGYILGVDLFKIWSWNSSTVFRWVNTEFDGAEFRVDFNRNVSDGAGSILVEDAKFTVSGEAQFFFVGTDTPGTAVVRRLAVDGNLRYSGNGNYLGLLSEYVVCTKQFHCGANLTYTEGDANNAVVRKVGSFSTIGYGSFFLQGQMDDSYFFMDLERVGGGNPHFGGGLGNARLVNPTWDYYGGYGGDSGDPFNSAAGNKHKIHGGLVLIGVPTDATPYIHAGPFWSYSAALAPSDPATEVWLTRCTIALPTGQKGLKFCHSPYSGPGERIFMDECLFVRYGAAATNTAALFHEESGAPPVMSPDMATVANCWGHGLDTFPNTVGGATVNGYGVAHYIASETLPVVNELADSPGFVDDARNFVAWCRTRQGHTGTDREVVDAGVADMLADPTLIDDLNSWVRAGWAPTNTGLQVATGGEWVGAVQGASGGVTVTVAPGTAALRVYERRQFTATVTGDADTSVIWSVVSGGGTITPGGRYEAPLIPRNGGPVTVTIRATSVADPDASDDATITLTHPFAGVPTADVGGQRPIDPWYDPDRYIQPTLPDMQFFYREDSPLKSLARPSLGIPAHPKSDEMMEYFGNDGISLRADTAWPPVGGGMPLSLVDGSTLPDATIHFGGTSDPSSVMPDFSDPGPRKLSPGLRIQGDVGIDPREEDLGGDCHICNLDMETGEFYEGYGAWKDPDGDGWWIACGFAYNVFTGHWMTNVPEDDPRYVAPGYHRWPATVSTAAGLPLFPLCFRYDELYIHGRIRHKLGMTMPNSKIMGIAWWPAIGAASFNTARSRDEWGTTIPYGATLRFKESWYTANVSAVDPVTKEDTGPPLGTWGPGMRVILRCLYEYGAIITDGGAPGALWNLADTRYGTEGSMVGALPYPNRWDGDLDGVYLTSLGDMEVVDHIDGETLRYTITPTVAATGVPRQVRVDCDYWVNHPDAHPGNDEREYWIVFKDGETHQSLFYPAAGEPSFEASIKLTPERPYANFLITPSAGQENPRFYPVTNTISMPWAHYEPRPVFWTTNEDEPVVLDTIPSPFTLAPGESRVFQTTCTGVSATFAWWSFVTYPPGVTVDWPTWTLTAGLVEGVGEIEMRLQADPMVYRRVPITVTSVGATVAVTVTPSTASVLVGGTQQFAASVTGTLNTNVIWSKVSGVGTINGAGLYSAGSVEGEAIIRATSAEDTSKHDDATITVGAGTTPPPSNPTSIGRTRRRVVAAIMRGRN